jgi:mercuric ion transport protein
MSVEKSGGSRVLVVGGVAALLASSCCLGPLLLIFLGFSGAWIGNLAKLEPYRPLFLALTLFALAFAGYQIFRNENSCDVQGACATPRTKRFQKTTFYLVIALAVIAFGFPYVAGFFY